MVDHLTKEKLLEWYLKWDTGKAVFYVFLKMSWLAMRVFSQGA